MKTKNRIAELEPIESNGHVKKGGKSVQLVELNRKTIAITIRGISPLIVHAWGAKALKMIEDKQQKKGKAPREAKDPKEEMESCFYRDDDNDYCIPASAIKNAIVSAATSLDDKINFSQKKIKQALFVVGDKLKIKASNPVMRTDMVRVGGMSKSADVRYRPMFEEWSCTFPVEFNGSVYSESQIVQLIEIAGFAVGICEWRPERGGNFGRFTVKS